MYLCIYASVPTYLPNTCRPVLASKHEEVKKKVVLLALMNLAFERGSSARTISFAAVAERTFIPLEQVEWVVMRAMSLHLVRGSIDQVEQSVTVSWVQPRILDAPQLAVMSGQLGAWAHKAKDALVTVEERTMELYC